MTQWTHRLHFLISWTGCPGTGWAITLGVGFLKIRSQARRVKDPQRGQGGLRPQADNVHGNGENTERSGGPDQRAVRYAYSG